MKCPLWVEESTLVSASAVLQPKWNLPLPFPLPVAAHANETAAWAMAPTACAQTATTDSNPERVWVVLNGPLKSHADEIATPKARK